jgi:1,4-dihydroxy-2-naphthoate octaprenyltransferase
VSNVNPKLRLALCAIIVAGSAGYGFLVSLDSGLADAVALGYVSVLLTIIVLIELGKRTHDRH